MVHHVTVQHEDAGVVEEAGAEDGGAAVARHDDRVAPRQVGLPLSVYLRDLERIGVDVEDMVVVSDSGPPRILNGLPEGLKWP